MEKQKLIEELLSKTPDLDRCPDFRIDDKGPYCGHNFRGNTNPNEYRRFVCDTASLQIWCLDKKKYKTCIYFKGEPFH